MPPDPSSQPLVETDRDLAETGRDSVVLLDEDAQPIGTADRIAVHTESTPLHLAFSTYLFNRAGEVLLTRRALSKKTWAGVWTNSCCGHPKPGESLEDAARRRIHEELGLTVGELTPLIPNFRYRAVDASGVVENEVCPVFGAMVDGDDPVPNPAEVAEWAWVPWQDVLTAVTATPQAYSPWAVLQVPTVAARLAKVSAGVPTDPDPAAAIDDVDALLTDELDRLGAEWEHFTEGLKVDVLPRDLPSWLSELLVAQGKRLRVTMSYWGFIATGGVHGSVGYANLIRAAAALETLHLFALVHDDIMDESTSRRGRRAAHLEASGWHAGGGSRGDRDQFGINMAMLLGDLAHTLADRLIDPLPPAMREEWYTLSLELIAGQRADLTGAAAGRRDSLYAGHVARAKSGRYTVTRPLVMGAIAAGAPPAVRDALFEAGDHLGRAFALRDDYLGVWGDPTVTGKPAGDDLFEAKVTILLALATERLDGEGARLLDLVGTPGFSRGDVARLSDAMKAGGVATEVERLISDSVSAALTRLDSADLVNEGVAGLRDAAHLVAWRSA